MAEAMHCSRTEPMHLNEAQPAAATASTACQCATRSHHRQPPVLHDHPQELPSAVPSPGGSREVAPPVCLRRHCALREVLPGRPGGLIRGLPTRTRRFSAASDRAAFAACCMPRPTALRRCPATPCRCIQPRTSSTRCGDRRRFESATTFASVWPSIRKRRSFGSRVCNAVAQVLRWPQVRPAGSSARRPLPAPATGAFAAAPPRRLIDHEIPQVAGKRLQRLDHLIGVRRGVLRQRNVLGRDDGECQQERLSGEASSGVAPTASRAALPCLRLRNAFRGGGGVAQWLRSSRHRPERNASASPAARTAGARLQR